MGRPNPYATESNGLKIDFPRAANERIPYFNIGYAIGPTGATTALTVINADSATFITVKFTDKKGVSASHTFKPVATLDTATLDTSSLDASSAWVLRVYAAESNLGSCSSTKENYCDTIDFPKSAQGDTVPTGLQLGFPSLIDNGSTSAGWDEDYQLASGETYELGEFVAADTLALYVSLFKQTTPTQETVPATYTTYTASATGDVVVTPIALPNTGTSQQILGLVLDIAAPGDYSAVVSFTSNDNAYPSYSFTINWSAA